MNAIKEIDISQYPTVVPMIPMTDAILMPNATASIFLDAKMAKVIFMSSVNNHFERDFVGIVHVLKQLEIEKTSEVPKIYKTGCLAHVMNVEEASPDEVEISLLGLHRFELEKTQDVQTEFGYMRTAQINFERYPQDSLPGQPIIENREQLLQIADYIFSNKGLSSHFDYVKKLPDKKMLAYLVSDIPLPMNEKQAIMDEPSFADQVKLLSAFMQHVVISNFYNQSFHASIN